MSVHARQDNKNRSKKQFHNLAVNNESLTRAGVGTIYRRMGTLNRCILRTV